MNYQRICENVAALYCKNQEGRKPVCQSRICESGRCTCMDWEQLSLLLAQMELGQDIKILEELCCKEHVVPKRDLISCGKVQAQYPESCKMSRIMFDFHDADNELRNIIRMIPVVQCVNMINKVEQRDSLCYMCLFGINGQDYLQKFLVDEIACCIRLYLQGEKGQLKAEGEKITRYVKRMQEIYENKNFNFFREKLSNVFKHYGEAFSSDDADLQIIGETLSHYYDKLEDERRKFPVQRTAYEYIFHGSSDAEIFRLSRFFTKIAKIIGLDLGREYRKFFHYSKRRQISHKIYDSLEKLLEQKGDFQEVLQDIASLFEHSEKLEEDEAIECLLDKYQVI